MKNLAGNTECDQYIKDELRRCGIKAVASPLTQSEVPYTITGKLGDFTFVRAWYYWCVQGNMPLDKARELYATEVGKTDIRVAGHCGCPPPDEWVTRFHGGKVVIDQEEWDKFPDSIMDLREEKYCTHPNPETLPAFVTSYHIDSELGLYLFAQAVKSLEPQTTGGEG